MPRLRRENGPEKLRAHWPLRGMCSAVYGSPDRADLPTVVKARHAPYPCPVVAYGVRDREVARTGQTRGKDRHEGTDRGPVRDARRLRLQRRGAGLLRLPLPRPRALDRRPRGRAPGPADGAQNLRDDVGDGAGSTRRGPRPDERAAQGGVLRDTRGTARMEQQPAGEGRPRRGGSVAK